MARCDDAGFFHIVGRSKDMFIGGGVNVDPVEIEAELLRCPAVRAAAVIGVPDPNWGEVGVAFGVLTDATIPSADELRNFLADEIASYKLPRDFIFVDALPRTAYGKVVKAELREWYERRSPKDSAGTYSLSRIISKCTTGDGCPSPVVRFCCENYCACACSSSSTPSPA